MFHQSASLEIGFWGTFNGVRYQIIGAGLWRMKYREYYTGSEGSGYESSHWSYTEWILLDPVENQLAYLTEDQEGFRFSTFLRATNRAVPNDSDDQYANFMSKSEGQRIIEYGVATLAEFEGKNGFETPEPNAKKFYVYEDTAKNQYSVEIPLNNSGDPVLDDRDYYMAVPLKYSEVLDAFSDNPAIKNRKNAQESLWFATNLARLVAWTFFILFCYSFFSYTEVFKHSFDLKTETLDSLGNPRNPIQDTLVEFFSPTWEIKEADAVYLIETEAFFSPMLTGRNPCDMFVQTAIIDEEAGVVNQMAGEFWEEYGRDSDGAWRETSRYTSIYARAEKKGKYSAWISVERMADMVEWGAKIEVRVYKYQFLWWYMMIYWLSALLLRAILGSYVKK